MKILVSILIFHLMLSSAQASSSITDELNKIKSSYGLLKSNFSTESCPFKPTSLAAMTEQLEEIYQTTKVSCLEGNTEIFRDLERKLDELTGILSLHESELYDQYDIDSYEQFEIQYEKIEKQYYYLMNLSKVMATFSTLVNDENCSVKLDKKNILPMLSELMVNASSFGAAMPVSTGLAFSYGTMAVGSMLSLVNVILQSKFDWELSENRQSYLKLNCAFYDLRKKIEHQGVFTIGSSEQLKVLQADKKIISQLNEQIESEIKSGLDEKIGIHQARLYHYLTKLKKTTFELDLDTTDKIYKNISEFLAIYKDVNELSKENFVEIFYQRLNYSLLAFNEEIPDVEQIQNDWAQLVYEKKIYQQLPEVFLRHFSWVIADIEEQKLVSAVQSDVKKDILILNNLIQARIENQESFLKGEGSSDLYDLLQSYNKIKASIYGKEGKSFVKHLLEDGTKSLDKFLKDWGRVSPVSHNCADLRQMRTLWLQAYSTAEMVSSFFGLNSDLIQMNTKINYYQKYLSVQMQSISNSEVKRGLVGKLLSDLEQNESIYYQLETIFVNKSCYL